MFPPLLWIGYFLGICFVATFWFRGMDTDLKRILVVVAALLALVFMTYKISTKYYPKSPALREAR